MLGRLEMDVDGCIAAYSYLAEAVFEQKLHSLPVDISGKVRSKFSSVKLESVITKILNDNGTSADDMFNDGEERGCKT
jgi:hypothetical protein